MATITEVAALPGSREVRINFTENEFKYVLGAGVNMLLTEGLLVLHEKNGNFAIGTEEALQEIENAQEQSKVSTKQ